MTELKERRGGRAAHAPGVPWITICRMIQNNLREVLGEITVDGNVLDPKTIRVYPTDRPPAGTPFRPGDAWIQVEATARPSPAAEQVERLREDLGRAQDRVRSLEARLAERADKARTAADRAEAS